MLRMVWIVLRIGHSDCLKKQCNEVLLETEGMKEKREGLSGIRTRIEKE